MRKSEGKSWWRQAHNVFLMLMLLSMAAGAGLGCLLRFGFGVTSRRAAKFVGFPGQVWMDLLRCMIIPLATVTVMASVLKQQLGATRKLAVLVILYYLTTTVLAAGLGVIPILLLRPGQLGANAEERNKDFEGANTIPFIDSLLDLVRNLFPDSIVGATFQVRRSVMPENSTNLEEIQVKTVPGMNVMGLIVLSAAFAVFVRQVSSGDILRSLVQALFEVIVRALHYLKWASPIGLTFLIAQRVLEMQDVTGSVVGLGIFVGLYIGSLCVHGFVILLLIFFVTTRRNPLKFFKESFPAVVTAFATSSSAATMGVSRECCVGGLRVREAVADFMIPIGATLNMDGGAIYLAGASIFIAQLNSITLDAAKICLIIFSSFAFAVGGAAVPSAGLISLQMTLHAAALPVHDVPLLVAVEWITDRSLTILNVMGDLYGCCVVEKIFGFLWGTEALDADKEMDGVVDLDSRTTQL